MHLSAGRVLLSFYYSQRDILLIMRFLMSILILQIHTLRDANIRKYYLHIIYISMMHNPPVNFFPARRKYKRIFFVLYKQNNHFCGPQDFTLLKMAL